MGDGSGWRTNYDRSAHAAIRRQNKKTGGFPVFMY